MTTSTGTTDGFRAVFLPDLHIGHARIPPGRLKHDLEELVYPYIQTSHMVIIGGDFYDELMHLDGAGGLTAVQIINDLKYYSAEFGVQLRVLQGTSQHDRRQLKMFRTSQGYIPDRVYEDPALQVYESMGVEQNRTYGLSILYIPDDLPYSSMMDHASEMIRSRGLDRVDLVVHHGYCEHLLPPNASIDRTNVYSADEYRRICSGLVLNGHIHTPSIYDDFIVSGGSFERLNHGEEEPKGFHMIRVNNGQYTVEFIENTRAAPFITVDLHSTGADTESAVEKIRRSLGTYDSDFFHNRNIHLRIITDDVEVKQAVAAYVRQNHDNVYLKSQRSGQQQKEEDALAEVELDLPSVTQDNLPGILYEHIDGKLSEDEIRSTLKSG